MASHAHDTVPHGAVVYMLDTAGVRKLEPNIACLEAIYSPNTGIVSYRAVALRLAELILQSASTKSVHRAIRTGFDVRSFERIAQQSSQAQGASITGIADNGLIRLSSASGEVVLARHVILAAGAYAGKRHIYAAVFYLCMSCTSHVVIALFSSPDEVAQRAGGSADPQIIPFRGSYLRLKPQYRHLVQRNVYPVPDPRVSLISSVIRLFMLRV